MKRTILLTSVKVLGTLTKIKYNSFDVDQLIKSARSYLQLMETYVSNNGIRYTSDHFKTLHRSAVSLVTRDTLPSIPFCKTDKKGIPVELKSLLWLLSSDVASYQRLGLTITRCYELLRSKPVWNPDPITNPGPPLSASFLKEFTLFAGRFTKMTGMRNLKVPARNRLFTHLVQGPNGPSILQSGLDARAVMADDVLMSNLSRLAALTGASWLITYMKNMAVHVPPGTYKSGKISLLAEGGCKTRTIGIGDFWSQNVLKPIHDKLMFCLKKLVTDGAWDQNAQVERILRECKGHAYSYDLSSATDRFPLELQKIVLSFVFTKEISDAWADVLVQRPFAYNNIVVKWAVGQPLGMLSSWAAFSLTHHVIIEYCAFKEGIKSFKDYAIIGDDVVIWNPGVALRYKGLMEEIGVSINLSKSLISDDQHCRVEFAKRILLDGVELTGLRWNLLNLAQKHIHMFPDLIKVSNERHYGLPWIEFAVPAYRSLKRIGLLASLLMDTLGEVPPAFAGVIPPGVTLSMLRDKIKELRIASIKDKQERLSDLYKEMKPLADIIQAWREGYSTNQHSPEGIDILTLHPTVWAVHQVSEELKEALRKLEAPEGGELTPEAYLEVEYLPIPSMWVYQGDRKDLKTEFHSNLVMKAWSQLVATTSQENT